MKTKEELNAAILSLSMTIAEFYPELSAFLMETPLDKTSGDLTEIDIAMLQDYNDSLENLLTQYWSSHTPALHCQL